MCRAEGDGCTRVLAPCKLFTYAVSVACSRLSREGTSGCAVKRWWEGSNRQRERGVGYRMGGGGAEGAGMSY